MLIPRKSIIYCDPPYIGRKGYECVKDFDYEIFYAWCRSRAAEGHKVFISELSMPSDFRVIWEREICYSIGRSSERVVEKLFIAGDKNVDQRGMSVMRLPGFE